jgi:RimJ/RimL family protein N-acetyltransferase
VSAASYRAATLDDAELASDLMSAAYPAMTHDPVMTRFRWGNLRKGYEAGRFIAELDGSPVAFLAWLHGPWEKVPDRHAEVEVWLDRTHLDGRVLETMWAWIADRALEQGCLVLLAYAAEDEPEMLAALAALGYTAERIEKVWALELGKHGPRLIEEAAAARCSMERQNIGLTTVAEWKDEEKLRKLYRLSERTVQDVPHTLPIVPELYEDFLKRFESPDRRLDRWWIAIDGDRPVAMSYLKFPPVRGTIWTGYTCTDRDYRGRGIARAVKLQSLAQGAELGVTVVQTDNDSENAPMLHINERLGYERRPGWVEHHKRVELQGA